MMKDQMPMQIALSNGPVESGRRLSHGFRWLLPLATLIALGFAMPAQSARPTIDDSPTARRDGHRLIRMNIASQAQLNLALSLGAEPWNCVIGPGEQLFSVAPRVGRQLQALGMRYATVNEDVQKLIDADLARMHAQMNAPQGAGGVAGAAGWFDDFKTYPQIDAYLDALVALRPDLASRVTAGTTLQGRPIHAMRITSSAGGSDKPAVMITACQHAREWAAVMTAMYAIDSLVRGYGVDARITALLDRVEFLIVPVANPDGYEFTYLSPGGDRLWRKNRRDNGNGTFGVDLNRNWSVGWGGPNSTSTNGSSEVYIGAAAFSEPETAALRDFMLARPRLVAHIDFHSFAQLVLQPNHRDAVDNGNHDLIDAVGTAMNDGLASVNGFFYQNGWGASLLYAASGVAPDWTYTVGGMLGYTIEVRDTGTYGFIMPAAAIVPTAQENFAAVLNLAERATSGAEFLFPHGVPTTLVAGSPTTLRVDIRPTPQAPLDAASARIRWRVGSSGPFASTILTPMATHQYQGVIPALACGQRLEYFMEIETGTGTTQFSPRNAPATVYSATAARTLWSDNFQAASGWTTSVAGATSGAWQRGVPVNDPNWPYDPRSDADGSGSCWLTQNAPGNTDVDGGSVALTSPVVNVSAVLNPGERAGIDYAYFLHHVSPVSGDSVKLEVSASGAAGPFVQVAAHTTSGGALWRRGLVTADALAAAGVTLGSNVVLRFTATDGNPQSIIEAAIDDVRFIGDCASGACPGDVTRDGQINTDDLIALIGSWGACGPPAPPCAADIAPPGGNGAVNTDDLIVVITTWGACPP